MSHMKFFTYFFVEVFPEMQVSDFDHDWVILNLNMTGYYRVNYDKLGWKKLNQQLEKDPKVRLFFILLLNSIYIAVSSLSESSFHTPVWWEETLPVPTLITTPHPKAHWRGFLFFVFHRKRRFGLNVLCF